MNGPFCIYEIFRYNKSVNERRDSSGGPLFYGATGCGA